MYITLYFIVTGLPESHRAVRDHFLALDPTDLTVDLLKKHLLAAKTSVVAVGAARGTPHTPFFEGCPPSPLAPSYAFATAVDILGAEDARAASALSGKRRTSKGKGGGNGGSGGGSGGFGGGGGGSGRGGGGGGGGCGSGGGNSGGGRGGAVHRGGSGIGQRQKQQRRSENPMPQQLREWFAVRCPYVIRTGDRAGQTCGKFHTHHLCFSRLDDAWRAEFGDEAERPRRLELLRSGVDVFALDYDAILAAMYALSVSAEGDCYQCVPPDPRIEAAALGASEYALPGTAPAEALHTFTLDSGASHCFFHSPSLHSLHLFQSERLTPQGAQFLPVPPMFSLRLQLREDLPVLRPHSNRDGEFSSDLLRDFCRGEGILQSFTLPASPQQNGIGECRIGLVMEVARTSMVHAAAPHFLWPFEVRYAAHQLNIWLRISLPETSPTLRWTGKLGDASVFRVWGSRAFVRDTSADKLYSRAIPCVFLGFSPMPRSTTRLRVAWPGVCRCLLPLVGVPGTSMLGGADGATLSQWLSRDAAARLAIRNHLPLAECAHFEQHCSRSLLLPCHCFSRPPASALPVPLPSAVAVGAARGPPRPPFFEGCSPSPLAPSYASAAAADVSVAEDVGAASASAKHRSGKGKGGKGGGGGGGGGGGSSGSSGGGSSGGGGGGGTGGGSGGSGGGGGGNGGSGGGGGSGTGGGGTGARRVGSGGGQRQQQQRQSETQSPQQLQFDAILSAMYALFVSAEGDCYRCVPPDPGIAAAALGASESGTLPGTASAQALHTFMLDSGASACFFRDSTTLTPLSTTVPVRLADPSGGPVVARSSNVLLCLAVPSGSLLGLHLPSFSTNLVSTTALQDAMVTTTTPGGQRVTICTCTRTGRHLAPFIRRPGSSLYTLATEPPQVAASAQVSASGQVAASCSCRLLSHQTLLWHHRLGHPSLPRLRGMHSRLLVSGLPMSLPPLPPSPAPPCLPCIEGRQHATPHSSSFPPTSAPMQTIHMDVWGPARVSGQSCERYFLLVVDDYTRYTTVFPLRSKGQVVDVLIPWIRTVRLQLRERFCQDLPVLRLRSDRGGEFSSNLLRDFCRGEGILQSFMLPDSPQQNGIAERRIGLVMEVARTSMIHAAAPHFLWPFAVRYAAHQLNLWPRVSLPETSPTLRWTGKVGDASMFRVWGSRAFVRDTFADKLSPRAIPCVFLGFVLDAPGWQFYHPTSRRVFPSQDVTFEESVPFYRLFPYRSAPPPPPPLFVAPGPPPVDPLPPQGPAPLGVSQIDPLPGPAPVQVAVGSGASRGAASGGAGPWGATSRGAGPGGAESEGAETGGAKPRGVELGGGEPGGTEPEGVEPVGAVSEGAESGGAEPQGAALSGGSAGASPRLSPQQLQEWFVRRARLRAGATAAGGARVAAGAGVPGGTAVTGPGGARTRDTRAAGTGGVEGAGAGDPTESGATGAGGSGAGGVGARGAGVGGTGAGGAGVGGPGVGGAGAGGAGAVDPGGAVRPRPYFVPLLQQVPDPESDRTCAANPTISRLLATAVIDPSFESAAASALIAELLDFAAACRLDYANALVAESASASPLSVRGECALGTDVLEDFECLAAAAPRFASMLLAPEGDPDAPNIPTPRSYAEAITGPYSSQWQAAMDAEMASWKSTGTYVDEVPPPGANIVDGMWIFRVKRPQGSPPVFKARYIARGFRQRQGVDYFQTFSPTPKMTTLWVLLHVAAQRDYELHSLDFGTAFLQGSLHEEIWLCRPPGFTEPFPAGTQWSLRRPVYGLRVAPREWHDTLRTTLAALGFAPATADPSLFLHTDTSLPPFYVLVYVDDLVFATAGTEALTLVKLELQKRHTCTDLGVLRLGVLSR
ncbi:unnamed protein product [Closterium sp. NIES-54]